MIFRIILYAFLAYLLYKIVFDLIIPVYKTTRQFKKGFREMSARMNRSDGQESRNEQVKEQQNQSFPQNNTKPASQKPAGDYIDFEEIK